MFELLRKDIKTGDTVKLYLITGKEPEGIVLEIGVDFILIQAENNSINRFFDKLIGGWDIIAQVPEKETQQVIILQHDHGNVEIDQPFLLEKSKTLLTRLPKEVLEQKFASTANIIQQQGSLYIAASKGGAELTLTADQIIGDKLLKLLKEFAIGSNIPVILISTRAVNKKNIVGVVLPSTLLQYLKYFINLIEQKDYSKASALLYLIDSVLKPDPDIYDIINEIKKIKTATKPNATITNPVHTEVPDDDKRAFKNVEKEINDLIRQSEFEFALSQIEKELSIKSIDDKYKSTLLLKKAQIYSSINNPDASELAYQELVKFNVKINAPTNNLSHLYTELARLQAIKTDKQSLALESVKEALKYNPNNNYAINLLRQFEGKTGKPENIKSNFNPDENLLIDAEDDSGAISKMIDLDIKEHRYSHPEIIRNGGIPSAFIAKKILEEAKVTKEVDLSERYPLYLEAAKAFSELNVGSYDLQDYLESVAYYAILKGNSLYLNFKKQIGNGELDTLRLTRLKDSSCSYYIESLNLLSNIEPKLLLSILANYLKINIVIYHIKNKSLADFSELFKGQFADVFKSCLRNKNLDIEKIAYSTILSVGASSILAWNELGKLDKGTSRLYLEFKYDSNKKKIFGLLNQLNQSEINIKLNPKDFLKTLFQAKKNKENEFQNRLNNITTINFEPTLFGELISSFNKLNAYNYILNDTDNETKAEIEKLLSIFQPYLHRGQSERTNILIQARNQLEKQIGFINDNTTFYGRTFFYGLLTKWKREVDKLLDEKIAQSYPSLSVLIDPPYYIFTNELISAPLIIINNGEATSEGFLLKIECESIVYDEIAEFSFETKDEVPAGGKKEISYAIPHEIIGDTKAVEIKIQVTGIYQKKQLAPKTFQYTIEEEPKSVLSYDDIPWRDGPIPPEHLFKGRKRLIADLAQHYLSIEKDKPYILYGLTRTGKSSILEYLRKDLEGDSFFSKTKEMTVLTFSWDLSVAASFKKAQDFWEYILYQQTFEELEKYALKYNFDIKDLNIKENVRAKDLKIILDYLVTKNLYPIFFIDEFSFIKTLIDDKTINTAFLHTLRQFALAESASFIFAGTYDIKSLIKDPSYGITGQLVNAIEEQINEINDEAAEELIEVIDEKLSFTPEAIAHIKFLSGNVPYFIQIICKHCGYYSAENKRRYIGYPELEKVIKILIGQEPSSYQSLVKKLPENTFQNNQYSPADPKEVAVLITSIAFINKDRIDDPRGVGFAELQKLWADKNVTAFRPKLADAINLLKEKKILIQEEDEGTPIYKLSVDLFRRWWAFHHQDINLTLTTLTE